MYIGAAAKSIKSKFIGLFNETPEGADVPTGKMFPKPAQIIDCSVSFLRTAGLSERKAEYIKGLAEKFHCGDLSAKWLIKASDEEVLEKLVYSPFVLLFLTCYSPTLVDNYYFLITVFSFFLHQRIWSVDVRTPRSL